MAALATRLGALIQKYDQILPNVSTGIETISDVAGDLEECLAEHTGPIPVDSSLFYDPDLQALEKAMRDMLDTDALLMIQKRNLDAIRASLLAQNSALDPKDILETFKAKVADESSEYNERPVATKYQSAAYKDFCERIWSVRHPGQEFEHNEDDDDIQVIGVTVTYKCPITLGIMDDPYTCSACNHSYSSAILELIRGKPNGDACPVSGCRAIVTVANTRRDTKLARKVKRWRDAQNELDEQVDMDIID